MLSTTAEYALRIMMVLAESDGGPVTSERIAERTKVPSDYSVKVLQILGRAKLVRAQRGRGGGFRLACDPKVTTLLDVVNAIDPLERIERCPLGRDEHNGMLCPLHSRIDQVIALLQESFQQMTLASVIDGTEGPPLCEPATVVATTNGDPASRPSAN
jgi:Rrf2 family protein